MLFCGFDLWLNNEIYVTLRNVREDLKELELYLLNVQHSNELYILHLFEKASCYGIIVFTVYLLQYLFYITAIASADLLKLNKLFLVFKLLQFSIV